MDFSRRSYQPELLDGDDIPFKDILRNMQELNKVNYWLGGHRITLAGFRRLLEKRISASIAEIGCGGGDNLQYLDKWCARHHIALQTTGIDLNENCIIVAERQSWIRKPQFITSDYKIALEGPPSTDIIFSSLFCHHFPETELIFMLQWMRARSRTGFFINDLHRHPFAYYSIKWITRFFSKSYLVKNDGPLSVLRGLTRKEWIKVLDAAGIRNYSIQWKWAFRWLIIVSSS